MAEITVKDLIEQGFDNLRSEMEAGFRGVHGRIGEVRDQVARQNGRIGKLETSVARVDERVEQLQRENGAQDAQLVDLNRRFHLHHRKSDRLSLGVPHTRAEDSKPITRRDVVVATSAASVAIAAVMIVLKLTGVLPS